MSCCSALLAKHCCCIGTAKGTHSRVKGQHICLGAVVPGYKALSRIQDWQLEVIGCAVQQLYCGVLLWPCLAVWIRTRIVVHAVATQTKATATLQKGLFLDANAEAMTSLVS